MNKLRYWISGIVLLAIIGYSAFWYYQAMLLQNMFEEKRGKVEETPNQDFSLNFSQIKTSGYPFSIELAFENPTIDCALKSELLHISIALNGKMVNSFTPFGRLKKVTTAGKTHLDIQENDGKPIFEAVADGEMALESKLKGYLWSAILHPFSTKKDDFEDVDLHLSSVQLSCDIQGKKAGSIHFNDGAFHYQKNPSAQTIDLATDFVLDTSLRAQEDATEQNASPIPQTNLEKFLAILSKACEKYSPEKTSCLLDAKIELPSIEILQKISQNPLLLMSDPFPKFSIDVKKFNTSSAFGSFQHSGYITFSEDSSKLITIKFSNDAKNSYTDVYYTKTLALIDDIAKMMETELPADNEDLVRLKALFHDHLDAVKALVPQLQKLGINAWTGTGLFQVNRENYNFSGNITNCGFKDDLYGVLLNLDAKRENADISCKLVLNGINYKTLIQDLTDYFNRFTTVFNLLKQPETQSLNQISEKTKERILEYLAAISDDPKGSSSDLKITVNYDTTGIKVGTLDFATFLAYSIYLQDLMQKQVYPAPAALPSQQSTSQQN